MLDTRLLDILACPICKAPVQFMRERNELWCTVDGLAFPVRDDIPVMLENEARALTQEEREGRA